MLSRSEVSWLNQYHSYVFEQLSPMLEPEELQVAGKCHRPPAHLIFLNRSKAVRFSDGFFLLQIVKFLYNQV